MVTGSAVVKVDIASLAVTHPHPWSIYRAAPWAHPPDIIWLDLVLVQQIAARILRNGIHGDIV
jgi:hypothetical protein